MKLFGLLKVTNPKRLKNEWVPKKTSRVSVNILLCETTLAKINGVCGSSKCVNAKISCCTSMFQWLIQKERAISARNNLSGLLQMIRRFFYTHNDLIVGKLN